MLHRTTVTTPPRIPLRPVRVLVEDPRAMSGDLQAPPAFEVTTCAGPGEGEVCLLVMDGRCPLGPCDVVVTALDGPWARSVRAAWLETGTAVVDAGELATADPSARLAHHVGAAMQQLWASEVPAE